MKRNQLDETVIHRRISFLLEEASSSNPVYDQSISMIMRVISNFYSVGTNSSNSSTIKKLSRWISKEALEIRDDPKWDTLVELDHQEPLKDVWNWIVTNHDKLNVEQVANRIKDWPMVVITKSEHSKIRNTKYSSPDERYENAEIEVIDIQGAKSYGR